MVGRCGCASSRRLPCPPAAGRDGASLEVLLERWLRERAREVIAARIATRAVEMDVHPGGLSIRDQTTRWASAARSGDLSFCWRLLLAPPEVLDAIVVHELAHLLVPGHSRTFWALVERHAPQARAAHRWLRAHAHELRTALG
jgi:predicted metal-dependent hydrolase